MKNRNLSDVFYLESDFIHLNISELATSVLGADEIIFRASAQTGYAVHGSTSVSGGFINLILENMLALVREESPSIEIHHEFVMIRDYQSYARVRLHGSLIDDFNTFFEEKDVSSEVIKRPSQYLKVLLETYARLPFLERERIVLKKHMDVIQNAIMKKKVLHLTYIQKRMTMEPLWIEASKEGTYSYLVGTENGGMKILRISRIETIRLGGSIKPIPESKLREYREKLTKYGPTFAEDEVVTVKVRLTDRGVESYRYSVLHRPVHSRIEDGNIYVFECSERQVQYFFFRFAGDAEIISPPSLRKKFLELYQQGSDVYSELPKS